MPGCKHLRRRQIACVLFCRSLKPFISFKISIGKKNAKKINHVRDVVVLFFSSRHMQRVQDKPFKINKWFLMQIYFVQIYLLSTFLYYSLKRQALYSLLNKVKKDNLWVLHQSSFQSKIRFSQFFFSLEERPEKKKENKKIKKILGCLKLNTCFWY